MATKLPPVNESIPSAYNGFQNVQPLVYDNAISPYETISKLLWYVKHLVDTCNSIIDELTTVEGDIADLKQSVLDIKAQLEEIEGDITEINGRLDEHDTHLSQIDTQLQSITDSLNNINQEITGIKARLDEHDKKFEELDNEIDTINDTLTSLQNQITANDKDIESINSQIQSINSSISQINSTLDNLQAQITSNDSDISALQGRVNTLENDLNALETTVEENRADLQQQITNNKTTHDNAIKALQERATTLETDVGQLKTDVTNLKAQQLATDQNITTIQNSINTINNNISSINDNIDVINTTIDTMQENIQKNTDNIQTNTTAIQKNASDISELQTELADFNLDETKADVEALQQNVTDIQAKDKTQDTQIEGINDSITSLQQADTALQNSITGMQNNIESNTNAIQENDKQIDELNEKVTALKQVTPSISQDCLTNTIIKFEPAKVSGTQYNERLVTISAADNYYELYVFPISNVSNRYANYTIATAPLNKGNIDKICSFYRSSDPVAIYMVLKTVVYVTVHGVAEIVAEDLDTVKSYPKIGTIEYLNNVVPGYFWTNNTTTPETGALHVPFDNSKKMSILTVGWGAHLSCTFKIYMQPTDYHVLVLTSSHTPSATDSQLKEAINSIKIAPFSSVNGELIIGFSQGCDCHINRNDVYVSNVDSSIFNSATTPINSNIGNINEVKAQQALTEIESVDDRLTSAENSITTLTTVTDKLKGLFSNDVVSLEVAPEQNGIYQFDFFYNIDSADITSGTSTIFGKPLYLIMWNGQQVSSINEIIATSKTGSNYRGVQTVIYGGLIGANVYLDNGGTRLIIHMPVGSALPPTPTLQLMFSTALNVENPTVKSITQDKVTSDFVAVTRYNSINALQSQLTTLTSTVAKLSSKPQMNIINHQDLSVVYEFPESTDLTKAVSFIEMYHAGQSTELFVDTIINARSGVRILRTATPIDQLDQWFESYISDTTSTVWIKFLQPGCLVIQGTYNELKDFPADAKTKSLNVEYLTNTK